MTCVRARTARRCDGGMPLMPRSMSKTASMRRTASMASGAFAQLCQLEELAAAVCPARRVCHRPGLAARHIEIVEPGIGIGLQDAGISGQVLARMLAAPV
jgi:hypothetical protein